MWCSGKGRVHRSDICEAHHQNVWRVLRPPEVPTTAGVLPGLQRELHCRGTAGCLWAAAGNICKNTNAKHTNELMLSHIHVHTHATPEGLLLERLHGTAVQFGCYGKGHKRNKKGRIIKGTKGHLLMMWSMHKKEHGKNRVFFFLFLLSPHLHHHTCFLLVYNHYAFLLALSSFKYLFLLCFLCHHVTTLSFHPLTYSSVLFLYWNIHFSLSSFCASSCCLQIPFDEEAIRRALIAVHNFAVPQIKVFFSFLLFFHPTLSYSLVTLLSVFVLQ